MPARISVVVLTHNRCAELMRTLGGLARLPGRHPIIVVDNGSTDGSAEVVRRQFPGLDLVRSPANVGAAGRNLGVRAAHTEYVAFCDDDACWEPDALETAVGILDAAPEIGVLNARVLVGTEGRLDPACAAMQESPLPEQPGVGPCLLGFMAGACIMRTQVFRHAGGYWPPLLIGGEEALLALDVLDDGWRIVYAPAVCTRHWPSSVRDAPLRRRLLARNAVWTAWMRLPPRMAWDVTTREFRLQESARERVRLARDIGRGMAAVLARRRVVSSQVRELLACTGSPRSRRP
ncbi:glycosyltransferase family 2 protein [Bordetella sp. BOR01]|uniref:glycosyltransferase family 2 protein n=1 Tax=Bordetella sp. BOR01 TaxID=2854779 RepID=UPI001C46A768|nr:glycosyltransferase [Bordetella sp. BOR01]MBV7486115.1 glycosyltransferase [Bordetella sp. BOR01]